MQYRSPLPRLFGAIVVVVILCLSAAPSLATVLGPQWTFRRPLKVQVMPSNAPGQSIAWAQFYTDQHRLPSGADLRITNSGRLVMPMRIMRLSEHDDLVRVAFLAPSSGTYYVWWGNPQPGAAPPPLKIDRGVWLQVFHFGGGNTQTWRAMQQCFERAHEICSYFADNIFLGFDPRGFHSHDMLWFHAWLHIAKSGSYIFAFDCNDRGYINLDGHNVLSKRWGGGMWGRVRFKHTVYLKAGWHRLQAGQINFGGNAAIALDWIPPGQMRFEPVPAVAFAPVEQATVGRLQQVGASYAADFTLKPQAQIFVPPTHYFQRYTFTAAVPASFSPRVKWSFSDGQTAWGLRVDHEFMRPGVYSIGLTVVQAGHRFTTSRKIQIQPEMVQGFPYPPADPPAVVATILKTYNLQYLDATSLLRGVEFFRRYNAYPGLTAWGTAWAESTASASPRRVLKTANMLAQALLATDKYDAAADIYLAASHKRLSAKVRADLMARYVVAACNYTQNAQAALQKAKAFLEQHQHNAAARHAILAALTYAAVALGDGKAAAAYAKAAGSGGSQSYRQQEIQQGVWARNIESYIIGGHFDTARQLIYQWEGTYPRAILKGYTRLLRLKLLEREGRPLVAARIAQQYVLAEPNSFYAAELLYRASEALKLGGDDTDAAKVLHLLAKQYPESPYARKAIPMLGQ